MEFEFDAMQLAIKKEAAEFARRELNAGIAERDHEGEFNRELPTFAKEPLNIDSVIICYNKYGTKPEIVANMASAECARFNKKAEFLRQSLDQCPLSTPMAAVYACVRGN